MRGLEISYEAALGWVLKFEHSYKQRLQRHYRVGTSQVLQGEYRIEAAVELAVIYPAFCRGPSAAALGIRIIGAQSQPKLGPPRNAERKEPFCGGNDEVMANQGDRDRPKSRHYPTSNSILRQGADRQNHLQSGERP